MPSNRFFVFGTIEKKESLTLSIINNDFPQKEDPLPCISKKEIHHMLSVMRVSIGSTIELVNGEGTLITACLEKTTTERLFLSILSYETKIRPPSIHLYQGITKPHLLEWIVEKGCELGATTIGFFPGEKSEKKEISPNQMKRFQSILFSSLKQSGNLFLPRLIELPSITHWSKSDGALLFGDTSPEAPKMFLPTLSPITCVIGPESGLSQKEISHLKHSLQASGISLHHHTLRAETAAVSMLSILSFLLEK